MMVRFPRKPDEACASHVTYDDLTVIPGCRKTVTLGHLTRWARHTTGTDCTYIKFERDILMTFDCDQCETPEPVCRPELLFRGYPGPCPVCGSRNRRVGRSLPGI